MQGRKKELSQCADKSEHRGQGIDTCLLRAVKRERENRYKLEGDSVPNAFVSDVYLMQTCVTSHLDIQRDHS